MQQCGACRSFRAKFTTFRRILGAAPTLQCRLYLCLFLTRWCYRQLLGYVDHREAGGHLRIRSWRTYRLKLRKEIRSMLFADATLWSYDLEGNPVKVYHRCTESTHSRAVLLPHFFGRVDCIPVGHTHFLDQDRLVPRWWSRTIARAGSNSDLRFEVSCQSFAREFRLDVQPCSAAHTPLSCLPVAHRLTWCGAVECHL